MAEHAVQTTLERAVAAKAGTHLVKRYDGEVAFVGRYSTHEAAVEAERLDRAWLERFFKGYDDAGLPRPERPWEWEVI